MKQIIILFLLIAGLAVACAPSPTPAPTPAPHLPRSMKGYELYSWLVGDAWHFTLITGTNRTKTVEEVTSDEDLLTSDGWVRIHVQGVEAIQAVLSRVPEGEWVLWAGQGWATGTLGGGSDITLPPPAVVNAVKAHADELGLQFHVAQ